LRSYYLLTDMFVPGDIRLNYSHVERLIAGGATPAHEPLKLEAVREAGSNPLARRELGVINIGGPGKITVDGRAYSMQPRDGLYVAMGSAEGMARALAACRGPIQPRAGSRLRASQPDDACVLLRCSAVSGLESTFATAASTARS